MPNMTRATHIAAMAHGMQVRKGCEEPYLYHTIRVAEAVREAGEEEWVQMLAVLHDVVEDTDWNIERVAEELCSGGPGQKVSKIIRALPALTKLPHQDKVAAVEQLANDSVPREAIAVKLADRIDNLQDDDQAFFGSRWQAKQIPSTKRLLEIAASRGYKDSILYRRLKERLTEIQNSL